MMNSFLDTKMERVVEPMRQGQVEDKGDMPKKNNDGRDEGALNSPADGDVEGPEAEVKTEAGQDGETACDPSEMLPEPSELDRLVEELSSVKDRYLRLAAEFDNYKKIAQREQQNSVRFANEGLILGLLPIMDSLEQAMVASKKDKDVLMGIEMVLKQFLDLLKKFGAEVFSAEGSMFDPSRHEAVGEQVDPHKKKGQVVLEYQKGCLLNGRLLRPARVLVSKGDGSQG